MAATTPTFDLDTLSRSIEQRDVAAQLGLFADDAELVGYDKDNPPASPQVARGKEGIAKALEDIFSRDMKHRVVGAVANGDRAAYGIECEYPDGNRCGGAGGPCARPPAPAPISAPTEELIRL